MVKDSILPKKTLIGWRNADGESFPITNTDDVVVFEPFFYRGFSLLTSRFSRGLLHWYRIELFNFNPNSILHISSFIHLCEAFLGVRPHFNLFRFLFSLKATQKGGQISVVGGAGLQLYQGRSAKYLGLPLKTSLKGWHPRWFYVSNPSPSLPAYVGRRPVVKESWSSLPLDEEMKQVNALLQRLEACKKDDRVNDVGVVRSFVSHRIQPIKERVHLAFDYDVT